ncbi:hypothetical protein HELRODRAFT_189840 [Helobdella robusta]|uniref:BACK domain-containing protein n=1 Tax=Helobdella robusta TaxID=6412 RepID=T1FRE8_HELRO|nr:hypothetical protein HELRODRAFT_189840 [Helobdella robusta]ESN90338.1 hypothetical protein HELRODRAFT_189840 [Helobdella robusta]
MMKDVDDVESNDGSTGERIVLISKSGGRHQIDKNILHWFSDYFKGLVNSGMRDAHCRELTLDCLTNESLIEVKDYLSEYSTEVMESGGTCLKSLNEVEAGLEGAFYLLINNMIDSYIELLLKHLNESTCIRILDIANKYVLINQLEEKVIKCMSKNFKNISESSKTLLSPDEMFCLVASEEINANSEMDIFNMIIKWILKNQSRKCFAEKLLAEVRYSLMTTTEKQKCSAVLCDLNLHINHSKDKDSNISRTVGMLFATGSPKNVNLIGDVVHFIPVYDFVEACKTSSNCNVEPIPIKFKPPRRVGQPLKRLYYKASMVDNCLYLIEEGRGLTMTSKVSAYNLVTDVWFKCCSMHLERCNFYLGGLDGHLYVVSGYTPGVYETPTVEKYIPSENRWYMVEPLFLALPSLAGCVCNGMIYVSGGRDKGANVRNVVYRYDPSYNKWFSRAPMLTARCAHLMTSTENKIFAFGGSKEPSVDFILSDVMDGEMYDVESDQWSSVLKLKMPVSYLPSITINNCFYIFYECMARWDYPFIQKINLAKYLKNKKTSYDSSLSSVQCGNANNKNLVTNEAKEQNDAESDDDCQILNYFLPNYGNRTLECQYVGVMSVSDLDGSNKKTMLECVNSFYIVKDAGTKINPRCPPVMALHCKLFFFHIKIKSLGLVTEWLACPSTTSTTRVRILQFLQSQNHKLDRNLSKKPQAGDLSHKPVYNKTIYDLPLAMKNQNQQPMCDEGAENIKKDFSAFVDAEELEERKQKIVMKENATEDDIAAFKIQKVKYDTIVDTKLKREAAYALVCAIETRKPKSAGLMHCS